MKYLRVWALLLLVMFASGCTYATNYKTVAVDAANDDYSPQVAETWWQGYYKINDSSDEKTIVFDGTTYKGNYYFTNNVGATVYDIYKSNDPLMQFYLYHDSGELQGIHMPILGSVEYAEKPDVYASPEDALATAKSFAANYIDVLKYDVEIETTVKYKDSEKEYREYAFTFRKTIDGFKTSDKFVVTYSEKGDLIGFFKVDTGYFDGRENIKVDREKLSSSIDECVKICYEGKYEYEYEIAEQTLSGTPDGGVAVLSNIVVTLNNSGNTFRTAFVAATIISA